MTENLAAQAPRFSAGENVNTILGTPLTHRRF